MAEQEEGRRDRALERESANKEPPLQRTPRRRLAFGDVHDTLLTSSNSSKGHERFAIFTAIPTTSTSTPGTYTIHVVTTEIDLHISGYSSARGILCACVFLVAYMDPRIAYDIPSHLYRCVHVWLHIQWKARFAAFPYIYIYIL